VPALAGNSRSQPAVPVELVPVCHAGGRGFESRRSRLSKCLTRGARLCTADYVQSTRTMRVPSPSSSAIDWASSPFDIEQFRAGWTSSLSPGRGDPDTDVTGDDALLTGKIALTHLRELPDYYTRLARMKAEGEAASR